MKLSSLFLSLLFIWSYTSFGCKSNPITPPASNTQPEIILLPDSLHGIEYNNYTFKAKILNHELAETYFRWDWGDGSYPDGIDKFQNTHMWLRPGVFTMKVNAYDIYSDSIIATKSLRVSIDTFHHTVEIIPQFYNGMLKIDGFGNLSENFSLSAQFSSNPYSPYIFWDFGDGTKDSTSGSNVTHRFSGPGKYLITLNVFQADKVFDCSDTALVTINYPDVSLASLSQMGRVQAILYLDTSYSLYFNPAFSDPMALGSLFSNSGGYSSGWNGGNFSTSFHSETGLGTTNYERKDFLISGSLTADTKTIHSINVSVEDTTTLGKVNTMVKYGFKADNARLVGASEDQIIYKVTSSDLKNLLHDVVFSRYWVDNSDCPDLDPDYIARAINTHAQAQLLLVFSKK